MMEAIFGVYGLIAFCILVLKVYDLDLHREHARLEQIVIQQQAELKRLENANDRLRVEHAERGRVNARLNKQLHQLKKKEVL